MQKDQEEGYQELTVKDDDIEQEEQEQFENEQEKEDEDIEFELEPESESDSDSGKEAKEISKDELNARRMAVFDNLSNLQMDRYECFRRASFQKSKMARVMKYILRQNVNERMVISMQGIAKLFVGELIECARKVCMDRGEGGPLKPSHIHTAFQILCREGKIPCPSKLKRTF
eukprot:TRINITY_DN5870_c0_g2_i1.p2 TRINITY_DN5870_c0_g2~~TRINITY_DN5870_c0_g2_i1.p2  ORF type:complete len:173 (+),score=30.95 TRINITY_DN5870_c0_g2_i1:154-672(+)